MLVFVVLIAQLWKTDFSVRLTPQQLLYLPAGLRCCELVNDVKRSLAVGVSNSCVDPTLQGRARHVRAFTYLFI